MCDKVNKPIPHLTSRGLGLSCLGTAVELGVVHTCGYWKIIIGTTDLLVFRVETYRGPEDGSSRSRAYLRL